MDIKEISAELFKYIQEESIKIIDLIFNDPEIKKVYPDFSDKKDYIINKYFSDLDISNNKLNKSKVKNKPNKKNKITIIGLVIPIHTIG